MAVSRFVSAVPLGLWVFAGGCLGTAIRALLSARFPDTLTSMPVTTLTINVTGAFVLAWLLRSLALRGPDEGIRRILRLGVGTGVLGGYTTFSTFDVQSLELAKNHHPAAAAGYLGLSLAAGILAALAGTWLGSLTTKARR